MRVVTYSAAVSLDGFIGRPDDTTYDWIRESKDAEVILRDLWGQVDTLIMGRKTYEVALQMGGGTLGKIPTYVFSRTLTSIRRKGVTLVRDDAAAFVRDLKASDGKEIWLFGGGAFAAALFDAGLVDTVGVSVQPVLLGGGIPFLANTSCRVDLELTNCRQLDGGSVYLDYKVRSA